MTKVRIGSYVMAGWAAALVAALVTINQLTPASSLPVPAAPTGDTSAQKADALELLMMNFQSGASKGPVGLNPYLSFVPPGEPRDYDGWSRAAARLSAARAASAENQRARAARGQEVAPINRGDGVPAGTRGVNDTRNTATRVAGFGTTRGTSPRAILNGTLSPETVPNSALVTIPPNAEPDGAPAQARDVGVNDRRKGIKVSGVIGDGEISGTNEADLYKLTLQGGESVQATMSRKSGNLQPVLALYAADGSDEPLPAPAAVNNTDTTSTLVASARQPGTYYIVASGFETDLGSTSGRFELTIAASQDDPDLWAVDLRAGDVLGAALNIGGVVSVSGPNGTETQATSLDPSFSYPLNSPLPGANGKPVANYVAAKDGRYYVSYLGTKGAYRGSLEVYRFGGTNPQTQTIFLDTDGARVNTRIWTAGFGDVKLSPLSAFLDDWGLRPSQERPLVDAVKANVVENLRRDLAASGLSETVRVKVVTSLDGPDPTGKPGVTRLILGGTIAESGIPTIGIAQSIDPGNFARNETGLVLLDVLSAPADRVANPASANSYLRTGSNRVKFVGQVLGNITSHEVGHMIGNWHTDNANNTANMMDAGGFNNAQFYGVGRDGVGGTADDRDVDFVQDTYDPFEAFAGREDNRARSTWGMSAR
ncbi:MAG: hypothetical protein ACRCYU_17690 [Nocardioides sp.]